MEFQKVSNANETKRKPKKRRNSIQSERNGTELTRWVDNACPILFDSIPNCHCEMAATGQQQHRCYSNCCCCCCGLCWKSGFPSFFFLFFGLVWSGGFPQNFLCVVFVGRMWEENENEGKTRSSTTTSTSSSSTGSTENMVVVYNFFFFCDFEVLRARWFVDVVDTGYQLLFVCLFVCLSLLLSLVVFSFVVLTNSFYNLRVRFRVVVLGTECSGQNLPIT